MQTFSHQIIQALYLQIFDLWCRLLNANLPSVEMLHWACFYVEWHLLPNDDDDVIQIHFQLKCKKAENPGFGEWVKCFDNFFARFISRHAPAMIHYKSFSKKQSIIGEGKNLQLQWRRHWSSRIFYERKVSCQEIKGERSEIVRRPRWREAILSHRFSLLFLIRDHARYDGNFEICWLGSNHAIIVLKITFLSHHFFIAHFKFNWDKLRNDGKNVWRRGRRRS